MSSGTLGSGFDLGAAARADVVHEGFSLERPEGSAEELAGLLKAPPMRPAEARDLRDLAWSSIDNDTSRDLDQIEVAERTEAGIRVRVGIADVAASIPKDAPLDRFAREQTQTIYTPAHNFPMLPDELSTGLTSLNEGEDRAAIVTEFVVLPEGTLADATMYRAMVRNGAKLAYSRVGPWLEGRSGIEAGAGLQAQLRLQDEAARALRARRTREGALDFERGEAVPVMADGRVQTIASSTQNRAMRLIEDLMIATNEVVATKVHAAGRSSLRRVVRSPERWQRIVDLAEAAGASLPADADSGALNRFLEERRRADPEHYADLALAVIKLMGAGEYVLAPGDDPAPPGHFALAATDYAHATAPNRRFADLVTQRVVTAMLEQQAPPYTDEELSAIAAHCNDRDKAARKVERSMVKRVSALAMADRVGQNFRGVITGVSPKGTFVRVLDPPVEGMLVKGAEGLDVGDRVEVTLVHTDPQRAFIDFARSSGTAVGAAKG